MKLADDYWPTGDGEMAGRIRRHDWAATPLGPAAGWSERLRVMVEQVLATPLVAGFVCGSERLLIYNDAAARLYGDRHPAALGRPLPSTFPEDWATLDRFYARAFSGETVQTDAVGALLLRPVREKDGQVAYVLASGSEIGERIRAEQRIRETEDRYRSLFNSIDEGLAIVEMIYDDAGEIVDMIFRQVNAAYERQGDVSKVDGRSIREVLPGVGDVWLDRLKELARTGQPIRVDDYQQDVDRWFDVYFSRVDSDGHLVAITLKDITTRKRAEKTLRDSEARYQALLAASPMPSIIVAPNAPDFTIIGVNDVYVSATLSTREALIGRKLFDVFVYDPNHPGLQGTGEVARSFTRVLATRQTDVMPRVRQDMMTSDGELEPHWWLGVNAPMFDADGNIVAIIHQATRVTEQYYTETALRESDARFRQFARASSSGLWIMDANTRSMEFVSPAIGAIYGVESDALLGDAKRWAALVVPEDREVALGHLDDARLGEVAVHEFRIQRPSDGAFRWIRDTDFPLGDDGHVARIGGIAEDITETRQLTEHRGVLLAELQHRVRNIMGMIRAMANRTAPGASNVDEYRSLLEGRLLALARVQALLTREANAGGSLRTIIESEVMAQAHHGGQFSLTGPDIPLAPKTVEVLTLAFHELATNALKYGALSVPDGCLSVAWTPIEKRGAPWLSLDWVESGAPPRELPTRRGFGSELIEARIPYELGGRGTIAIGPEGARCHLEFPLKDGESILETDAPQPAIIFGGILDMTGAPDLSGRRVLVVEDDYYMANDAAAALRGAGAEVIGPCPSVEATRMLLEDALPTHAVLDLNLGGGGPQFEIAHLLKERGVPFVFLTGYDPDVIPPDMADVVMLQKPLPFREMVEAVGQLQPATRGT